MCDYSLHAHANRLAKEGERLVLTRFPGGSMGFASEEQHDQYAAWDNRRTRIEWNWSGIISYWKCRNAHKPQAPLIAVCVPPGARLQLRNIPLPMQSELAVTATEEVTFTQLSCEPYTYRDAVMFRNGKEVLLQKLSEHQAAKVLATGSSMDVEIPVPADAIPV